MIIKLPGNTCHLSLSGTCNTKHGCTKWFLALLDELSFVDLQS